jgi:hypothetical protein
MGCPEIYRGGDYHWKYDGIHPGIIRQRFHITDHDRNLLTWQNIHDRLGENIGALLIQQPGHIASPFPAS